MSRFTLIELVVVVTVIVLISGIAAVYAGRSTPTAAMERSFLELDRLFSHAGYLASLRGETVRLIYSSGSFQVEGESLRRSVFAVPDGVTADLKDGAVFLVFPDGSAAGAAFVLDSGKSELRIQPSPLTGRLLKL